LGRGKAADLAKFSLLRQPKPLYEQLAEAIRQKIVSGELAPGERLPREIDLALSLGVGRPSLREALKILQAMGVVTIRRGAGVFVANTGADELARRLNATPPLPPERLRDLFEVRKTLECQAAAWAAQRASATAIAELGELVVEMTGLVEGLDRGDTPPPVKELAQLDKTFHLRLTLSTENAALTRLMDSVMGMIEETMRYSLAIPGRPIQSVYDHRRVYQAVSARKPTAAARAMYAHVEGVQQCVFRQQQADAGQGDALVEEAERDGVLVLTCRRAGTTTSRKELATAERTVTGRASGAQRLGGQGG
jgi:GntR family transcriptional repressor for pyruvate dehydrogenase complex